MSVALENTPKARTSVKGLVTDSAIYGAGQFIAKGMRFLMVPLMTAYWAASQFGLYDLTMFVMTLMVPLNKAGMDAALNYYFGSAKTGEERTSIVSTASGVVALGSLLIFLFSLLLASPISRILLGSSEYKDLVYLVTLAAITSVWNEFSRALFKWRFMRLHYLGSSITTAFLLLTSIFLSLSRLNGGIKEFLLCLIFSNGVIAICNIYTLRHTYFAPVFSKILAWRMFVFGYPQVLTTLGAICLPFLSRPILSNYYDLSTVGVYALAIRMSGLVQFAYVGFTIAWAPFVYTQYSQPDAPEKFARVTTLVLSFLFLCSMCVSLFSPEIIKMVASGKQYQDAALLLSVLAFSPIFSCLAWIVPLGYNIAKKTYHSIWIYALVVSISIVLNIILIPRYGCWGAVYATLLSQFLHVVISGYTANRYYRIPYQWNKILTICLVGSSFTVAGFLLTFLPLHFSLLCRLILLLVYVFILFKSGIIKVDQLSQAAAFIRSKTAFLRPSN